jgi:phosphoribosylaminoimidazole-succinocarboxamide synthase
VKALYQSEETDLQLVARGKVRDVYALNDDVLVIVATDRISAFDVILPTPIPGKGEVLTQLSNFWFERTREIVPNHVVDPEPFAGRPGKEHLQGRSVAVRRCEALPVEAIVRGYLTGSGLKDYQRTGEVCGIRLPAGLVDGSRLPETIFAPSTKAAIGEHDENVSFEQIAGLVGAELAGRVRDVSIALYEAGAAYALERGIIIADTKFEFGLLDGELILIDEALTPDSSRFWPVDEYEPGHAQPSFDKQFVRDYLETLDWDKKAPGPELPDDIVDRTAAKYQEARRRLTERSQASRHASQGEG